MVSYSQLYHVIDVTADIIVPIVLLQHDGRLLQVHPPRDPTADDTDTASAGGNKFCAPRALFIHKIIHLLAQPAQQPLQPIIRSVLRPGPRGYHFPPALIASHYQML